MNEYIFYTTEGITWPPNEDKDIDNGQILGFVEARNSSEAMDLLLKNNPWIVKTGFSKSEIMIKQVLTKEQSKDIQAIVDYNWDEEKKHYQECGNYPKNHINTKKINRRPGEKLNFSTPKCELFKQVL